MTYTPNPKNRAFIRRANQALEFVDKYVKNTPNWLSTRWIHHKDNFGHLGNPLSQWLRTKLLICVNEHWDMKTGKCKQYIRNRQGYKEVLTLLNKKSQTTLITSEQEQQLVTGEFKYADKSDRYYNSLQYLETPVRKPLLASFGYRYNYDIICAAPTLIRQYADRCGLTKPTPALDTYIHNRIQVRQRLSQDLEITPKQAKQLIHALVNGAPVGVNRKWRIYQILNYDTAKIKWLQQDTYITSLRFDIKLCWQKIKPQVSLTSARFNSQAKSRVYTSLERIVMREVFKRLKKQQVRVFNEHDGWRCDQLVDQIDLRAHIKRITGYVVDFDYEVIDYV